MTFSTLHYAGFFCLVSLPPACTWTNGYHSSVESNCRDAFLNLSATLLLISDFFFFFCELTVVRLVPVRVRGLGFVIHILDKNDFGFCAMLLLTSFLLILVTEAKCTKCEREHSWSSG